MECKPADVKNLTKFPKVLTIGEPLLVPFYTTFDTDISGTSKDINGVLSSVTCIFISKKEIFISYSLKVVDSSRDFCKMPL